MAEKEGNHQFSSFLAYGGFTETAVILKDEEEREPA